MPYTISCVNGGGAIKYKDVKTKKCKCGKMMIDRLVGGDLMVPSSISEPRPNYFYWWCACGNKEFDEDFAGKYNLSQGLEECSDTYYTGQWRFVNHVIEKHPDKTDGEDLYNTDDRGYIISHICDICGEKLNGTR